MGKLPSPESHPLPSCCLFSDLWSGRSLCLWNKHFPIQLPPNDPEGTGTLSLNNNGGHGNWSCFGGTKEPHHSPCKTKASVLMGRAALCCTLHEVPHLCQHSGGLDLEAVKENLQQVEAKYATCAHCKLSITASGQSPPRGAQQAGQGEGCKYRMGRE